MPTNFTFLTSTPDFASFSSVAESAERLLHIDRDACVLNCRRAMEFAVKWMYTVDRELVMPHPDNLITMMNGDTFRGIVGEDIYRRMDFIRKLGNHAAHGGKPITEEQAVLCLENLFWFMDCVAYFYAPEYTEPKFDRSLLELTVDEVLAFVPNADIDIAGLMEENKSLREALTARRAEHQRTYVPKRLDLSEYRTRKLYIDVMLEDAGWTEGKDWLNDVELSENHVADYVLYGDDGRALAVLEAKCTCTDAEKGRQQAKRYADFLEKQYGRRPIIFLANGFDTRIWNDRYYPERKVASVYSKRDLEKLFELQSVRTSLKSAAIDKKIAGRYYQKDAVKAVCDSLDAKKRRKALLVMAAGSGKTRTVIALCDVLMRHGWVKNILFLADRHSLVTQAKRAFVKMLHALSVTNLCEDGGNYEAQCVFSTYETMMHRIDTVKDENNEKLYTVGYFDLVIVDEAHRSIYNKYRDMFTYFDAPLIGLTATPKEEIDKDTYKIYDAENGVPAYSYDLARAVKDGFLVDFTSVESNLKFIEAGLAYEDLPSKERESYENTFMGEDGEFSGRTVSAALNKWIGKSDTIKQVLRILMQDGLRIDGGEKLGKTIIFAKNHDHAEKILKIFEQEYPHLPGYAKVIDNCMTDVQNAIDDFADLEKLPQIAISVDMLDTGIDVPAVVNLVFFKRVMSKAKFWQMIGRGSRRCDGLMDGKDKDKFYVFDFCGNFEFFRMSPGQSAAEQMNLQAEIFRLQAQLAFKLQDNVRQTSDMAAFRKTLVRDMVRKVRALNRDNFAVRQHLRFVEQYSESTSYNTLTCEDTQQMAEELAPLLTADTEDISVVRFDALLYGIELAYLSGEPYSHLKTDLLRTVKGIADAADVPAVALQSELIGKILHTEYLKTAGIGEFERIRENFRELVKYIPVE